MKYDILKNLVAKGEVDCKGFVAVSINPTTGRNDEVIGFGKTDRAADKLAGDRPARIINMAGLKNG